MFESHWHKLIDGIKKKFVLVDEIDLLFIQNDPSDVFLQLRKFTDYVFKPNERLVITHLDTGFYIPGMPYSVTLYNFYCMVFCLGLPIEHMILLTNQNVKEEIKALSKIFNINEMQMINSFYNTIQSFEPPIVEIDIGIEKIGYSYSCINGVARSGRILMLCNLEDNNLIEKGIISYNFNNIENKITAKLVVNELLQMPLLLTNTLVNDRLFENSIVYNKHAHKFINNTKVSPLVTGSPNDKETRWQPKFLQHALVYLVTETTVNYPYPYLSEKTFKGFLIKRPMIIFGAPGCIKKIQNLGFKTWGNFWDEGYDDIISVNEKVEAIIQIIKRLSSLSVLDLQKICYEMENVLQYNYDWYVQNFSNDKLTETLASIDV